MPTLDLNNRTDHPLAIETPSVWVWTRRDWADDWQPRPEFFPDSLSWGAAPVIDAARFHYDYGLVLLPGTDEPQPYPRLDATRLYILVRVDQDDGTTRTWLGRTNPPKTKTHYPARQSFPETGSQIVEAAGFLQSLYRSPILSTVHEAKPGGELRRSPNLGASFNPDARKGNRTSAKQTLDVGDSSTKSAYAFADVHNKDAEHWTTRDAVEHLLRFQMPTIDGSLLDPATVPDDQTGLPWTIGDLSALPDWDKPKLGTDGRTTGELLGELLRPSKLLGYRVRPVVTHPTLDPGQTPHDDDVDLPIVEEIRVEFFTATRDDIDLPEIGSLPAAATQHSLESVADPLTTTTTTEDNLEPVDQIQLRGPREIAVATFRHGTDAELVDDWTASQQSDYLDGATGEDGYDDLSPSEKRRADGRVRDAENLASVYTRLKFVEEWDGKAEGDPVFVPAEDDDDESTDETHVPYAGLLEILPDLPLYESIDYSGAADEIDEAEGLKTIPPIITLENPDTATRERIETLGVTKTGDDNSNRALNPFSLALDVVSPLGLRMTVSGGPRHAIAGNGVDGTPADPDQETFGGYSYTTLEATLALRGNRRPAVLVPAQLDRPLVERKVITLEHPALELVHLAAATVVGIDPAGDPITSDGGVLRDPMPTLKALAEIVARHVLRPRRQLRIQTPRRFSDIEPGDLLTDADTYPDPIDAPVSQITLRLPRQTNPRRKPAAADVEIVAASYPANIEDLIR